MESLFVAIIEKTHITKSVCKFTKIALVPRSISLIFLITILRNIYIFTSWLPLKPFEIVAPIPFYYLQIYLTKEKFHVTKFTLVDLGHIFEILCLGSLFSVLDLDFFVLGPGS